MIASEMKEKKEAINILEHLLHEGSITLEEYQILTSAIHRSIGVSLLC